MENEDVQLEDSNLEENQDSNLEEVDETNEELEKAKKVAENQKIRAEKAEKELKALKAKKDDASTSKNDLNLLDIRALAKVHDDDVERVEKFAKSEGVSIAEALKNEDLQVILQSREEKRRTAEATNVGGGQKGSSQPSDDTLLEKMEKGEEMTEAEWDRAAKARIEKMKGK